MNIIFFKLFIFWTYATLLLCLCPIIHLFATAFPWFWTYTLTSPFLCPQNRLFLGHIRAFCILYVQTPYYPLNFDYFLDIFPYFYLYMSNSHIYPTAFPWFWTYTLTSPFLCPQNRLFLGHIRTFFILYVQTPYYPLNFDYFLDIFPYFYLYMSKHLIISLILTTFWTFSLTFISICPIPISISF